MPNCTKRDARVGPGVGVNPHLLKAFNLITDRPLDPTEPVGSYASCNRCRETFFQGPHEPSRRRCIVCTLEWQLGPSCQAAVTRIINELHAHMYDVLILCASRYHEDDNYECAQQVVAWLQSVIHRLEGEGE